MHPCIAADSGLLIIAVVGDNNNENIVIVMAVICSYNIGLVTYLALCLQCFEAVGWAAGRASGL